MKAFVFKLTLFSLILFILQVIVSILYPPNIPEEIEQIDQYLQDEVEIIYFGDSTVSYPRGEITIGDILQTMLPTYTIGEIAHPAYNVDLYARYVEYIVRSDRRPQAVIIPINMRSFSPEWDLRPSYQFETEKTILSYGRFLSTILYKPLDTLGGFDSEISSETFLNAPVYNGQTVVGTVAEFEQLLGNTTEAQDDGVEFVYHDTLPSEDDVEALKGLLIYYYMYDLSPNHRKLRSLLQIIDLLQANDIQPIFYITPINYQMGQRYIGQTFQEQLMENTRLVESILRNKNAEVLNLVFDLEAYTFTDTEHLRQTGKTYVAEQLARMVEPESFLAAADEPAEASATSPAPAGQLSPTAPATLVRATPTNRASRSTPTAAATALSPTPTVTTPTPSPTPAIDERLGQVIEIKASGMFQPPGKYAVSRYGLRFQSLDNNGQIVELQAEIFVPVVEEPTAFPVVVYGPGTTGLSQNCAPLNERFLGRNWGSYNAYMIEHGAQGYIGLLPNWMGFSDDDQTHPYFIAELQARVMLDAARAVYRFFEDEAIQNLEAEPLEAVFFGGYSSGGHAAFAAKDFAASYAPDVPLKGIIGHGATTNIEVLMRENPIFSPYIIYAYREFYGDQVITPDRVFLSGWLPTFDADVTTQCVDEIFRHYSFSSQQMYRAQFRDALYSGRLDATFPAFKAALDENSSGLSPEGSHIPVLILQGTGDTIITPPSQARFGAELCDLGNSVTYLIYPAVIHADIRRESFRDTLAWIDNIANGGLPENDCDSLVEP